MSRLDAPDVRDPEQARAVVEAVRLVERRPEADVPEALVRVRRGRADERERVGVLEQAGEEADTQLAELAGALEVSGEDVLALVAHQREVVVMAVRRIAHERLRHERRDQPVFARDDPADLPVGKEVVGIRERRVRGLVDLDLRPVLRVRMCDPEPHPAAVLEQVEHDRLELLEVGDLVERPGVGRVLEPPDSLRRSHMNSGSMPTNMLAPVSWRNVCSCRATVLRQS